MAAHQLIAPLPLMTLDAGCTITVEAIDPDAGTTVSGVIVSQVALYASASTLTVEVVPEQDNYFVFTADDA